MVTVQQAKEAANDIYDALSKPKQRQYIGELNTLFLFLEAIERAEKNAGQHPLAVDLPPAGGANEPSDDVELNK